MKKAVVILAFVAGLFAATVPDALSQAVAEPPLRRIYAGIGLRVNHDISAPLLEHSVNPKYSKQARDSQVEGVVVLSIVVQDDGSVTDAAVVKPLGFGLDEKATEAVIQWKFRPGLKNGVPVNVAETVEVNFKMRK